VERVCPRRPGGKDSVIRSASHMQTFRLASGTEIPAIGLGTWQLRGGAETVRTALELGYRLIDTAGDYGTQAAIGEAIRESGLPRKEVFLVTKVEETEDGYDATKDRLRELGLDYADLMLIHRPPSSGAGESIWTRLIRAKREGLTREIGVSNYSTDQMDAVAVATGEGPAVNQIEWSPFGHSWEMLEYCRERGILIQAYSPLTRGKRLDDPMLAEVGSRHGKTPAQVLIRWNIQLDTNPLPKASTPEHLQEDIAVFDFELSEEEMGRLSRLNEHYSALAGLAYA
jgi:2,5-diketo-D-gluconate reductase A